MEPDAPKQRSFSVNKPPAFRSRLSPSLADALSRSNLCSQFAAFLSYRGSAALLRFWLEADTRLRSASTSSETDSSAARNIAECCGLSTVLTDFNFEKGVAHSQLAVAEELQTHHFDSFKTSPYFANYQLELLNETMIASHVSDDGCLSLEDVVFYETSLFYFREFVEQLPQLEQASLLAMLNFYLASAAFTREYCSDTSLSDALDLYDKYLSLNAVRHLQIPDSVRRQVEECISDETGHPGSSSFDPAILEVRKLLSGEGILGKFFHSVPFQTLVADVRRRTSPQEVLSPSKSVGDDDRDSVVSSSSAIRRVTSLRVARIDELTGAYISEFKDPQHFDGNDSAVLPLPTHHKEDHKIKRIFRGSGASKAQAQRNQELEAERKAAEIIGEINAIISSSSPHSTPHSSVVFDE